MLASNVLQSRQKSIKSLGSTGCRTVYEDRLNSFMTCEIRGNLLNVTKTSRTTTLRS